jgi:uncharacterized protein (TIGR03084 family)
MARSVNLGELCDDLAAERDDLAALLQPLAEREWQRATPAPGWSILDQVTHLAWFDDAARQAIEEPDAFRAASPPALDDIDSFVDRVARDHRDRTGADTLSWLHNAGERLMTAARRRSPSVRIPWYGPDMTIASCMSARIMETWAHGQDIADTIGAHRPPTPRLRHIAFLGWRALPYSYRAHGLPVPEQPVRVDLGEWTFGPLEAPNVVRGSAEDFCLVVTQRRHLADTGLVAEGPVATEWLRIAQAFAGPPGAGRQPGEFA